MTHDAGRTDLVGCVADAVKPNSSETIGDKAKRHGDNVASAVQPQSSKGLGQEVAHTLNPEKHSTSVANGNHTTHATTGEKP